MKKIDLGSPNTLRTIFRLMIPAMISQLITVLYNIVDRMYIGNLPVDGEISLVGAGVDAPITVLITSFAYLITLGGAPLFSISLGQKNEEDARKIFTNSLYALLVVCIAVVGLSMALMKPMLYLFGASDVSYAYARSYLIWWFLAVPFAFMTLGLMQFLTAQGNAISVMIINVVSCILNIGLDPLFLYVFGLGVKGAAMATAISWAVSALMSLLFVIYQAPIKPVKTKPELRIIRKILKLGFSPFIITSTDSLILIVLNGVLQKTGNSSGDFFIECATIVQAFFSLVTGPLLGISSGTQPVLGYLYGAKETVLLKKAERQIVLCGLVFTTLCFGLSFVGARPFASSFLSFSGNSDTAVIDSSVKFIHWYMYPVMIMSFQYTLVDGLTGMGKANIYIWLSMNRKLVLILPLTIMLPMFLHDAEMAFLAEPIADATGGLVSAVVFMIVFPKILKRLETSSGSALDNA